MVTTRRAALSVIAQSLLVTTAAPHAVVAKTKAIKPVKKIGRRVTSNGSLPAAVVSKKTQSYEPTSLSLSTQSNVDHSPIVSMKNVNRNILFCLNDVEGQEITEDILVKATLLSRPSKRNRSPYVADVWLLKEKREALAHVPNLDMGGKCVPGCIILLKASIDKKTGQKLGPNAINPKFGTPKCEFIAQLIYVDDAARVEERMDNIMTTSTSLDMPYKPNARDIYPSVWVGAHPSLGERIAEIWIRNGHIPTSLLPEIKTVQKQVVNPFDYITNIRPDFCITHSDGTKRIIEVKTVVDTDYSSHLPLSNEPSNCDTTSPSKKKKKSQCIFTNDSIPYSRTAIFPFGTSNQKGPDGEVVVSARAIHHLTELTKIRQTTDIQVTILFVIVRNDVSQFSPNIGACPSFCKYLKAADDAGVQIIAKCVSFDINKDTPNLCNCCDDTIVPVVWP